MLTSKRRRTRVATLCTVRRWQALLKRLQRNVKDAYSPCPSQGANTALAAGDLDVEWSPGDEPKCVRLRDKGPCYAIAYDEHGRPYLGFDKSGTQLPPTDHLVTQERLRELVGAGVHLIGGGGSRRRGPVGTDSRERTESKDEASIPLQDEESLGELETLPEDNEHEEQKPKATTKRVEPNRRFDRMGRAIGMYRDWEERLKRLNGRVDYGTNRGTVTLSEGTAISMYFREYPDGSRCLTFKDPNRLRPFQTCADGGRYEIEIDGDTFLVAGEHEGYISYYDDAIRTVSDRVLAFRQVPGWEIIRRDLFGWFGSDWPTEQYVGDGVVEVSRRNGWSLETEYYVVGSPDMRYGSREAARNSDAGRAVEPPVVTIRDSTPTPEWVPYKARREYVEGSDRTQAEFDATVTQSRLIVAGLRADIERRVAAGEDDPCGSAFDALNAQLRFGGWFPAAQFPYADRRNRRLRRYLADLPIGTSDIEDYLRRSRAPMFGIRGAFCKDVAGKVHVWPTHVSTGDESNTFVHLTDLSPVRSTVRAGPVYGGAQIRESQSTLLRPEGPGETTVWFQSSALGGPAGASTHPILIHSNADMANPDLDGEILLEESERRWSIATGSRYEGPLARRWDRKWLYVPRDGYDPVPDMDAESIIAEVKRRFEVVYGAPMPEGILEAVLPDEIPTDLFHWKTDDFFRMFSGPSAVPYTVAEPDYWVSRLHGMVGRPSLATTVNPVTGYGNSRYEMYGGLEPDEGLLLRFRRRRRPTKPPVAIRFHDRPEIADRPLPVGNLLDQVDMVDHRAYLRADDPSLARYGVTLNPDGSFLREWYVIDPDPEIFEALSADPRVLGPSVRQALDELRSWYEDAAPGDMLPGGHSRGELWKYENVPLVFERIEAYLKQR